MFNLLLCLVITFSCGALGLIKSHTYTQRLQELNESRTMIRLLNNEITYRKDPLIQVFQRLASENNGISSEIMKSCAANMADFTDFSKCWTTAVDEVCHQSCLNKSDIMILKEISTLLGKSDIQGQKAMFELIEEKLGMQISQAIAERNSKGKMYSGLGFSLGIVLSVLMI